MWILLTNTPESSSRCPSWSSILLTGASMFLNIKKLGPNEMNLAVKNNQEKILLITMKNFSCVVRALRNLWKTRLSGTIFHIFVNYIRPYIRLYRPQERPLQGQKNNNSSFSHFWRRDYVKKITAAETKLPHQYVLKYIFLNRIKTAAKIFKVWKRNMKFTHTYSSGYFVTFKNYYLQIIILLRRILKKAL